MYPCHRIGLWRWPLAVVAVAACALAWPGTGQAAEVAVVVDLTVRPYVEALAGFQDTVQATVRVFENRENGDFADELALDGQVTQRAPALILAIGEEARRGVEGILPGTPKVFCMAMAESGTARPDPDTTGVTLAADPEGLAQVLDTLFPNLRRVGTVYDPAASSTLIGEAKEAFARHGKQLVAVPADDPSRLPELAQDILGRTDIFWMVPDRTLRNRDVLRFLLFATREQRKPLVAPSAKYVKAGALLATMPSARGAGHQAADMANQILSGARPITLPVRPAREFQVYISADRAREFHLDVPVPLDREVRYVP